MSDSPPSVSYGAGGLRLPSEVETLRVIGSTALAHEKGDPLYALALDTGAVRRTGRATDWAYVDDCAAVVPVGDPRRLDLFRLPTLEPIAEVALDAPASSLAAAGQWIAVLCEDATVKLVDPAGALHRFGPDDASALALTSDGRRLAVGTTTGQVTVLDTTSGDVVAALTMSRAVVTALQWSPDGAWLVAAGKRRAVAWSVDAIDGRATTAGKGDKAQVLPPVRQDTRIVGFVGNIVLLHSKVGTARDYAIIAVNLITGAESWRVTKQGTYPMITLVRGDRVFMADRAQIDELDAHTGAILRTASARCRVSAFDLWDAKLVTARWSRTRLDLLDVDTGEWHSTAGHDSLGVRAVQFVGDRFVTACDQAAYIWQRGRAEPVASYSGRPHESIAAAHLEGDTLWAGAADQVARVDLTDGTVTKSARLRQRVKFLAMVAGYLFVATDVSKSWPGEVALLDPATLGVLHSERLRWRIGHP